MIPDTDGAVAKWTKTDYVVQKYANLETLPKKTPMTSLNDGCDDNDGCVEAPGTCCANWPDANSRRCVATSRMGVPRRVTPFKEWTP